MMIVFILICKIVLNCFCLVNYNYFLFLKLFKQLCALFIYMHLLKIHILRQNLLF